MTRTPPDGVLLHPPSGEPIECVLMYVGAVLDHGHLVDCWEAMPVTVPETFGQEPGWHVSVRVLPGHTMVRLGLPADFDPGHIHLPPVTEES